MYYVVKRPIITEKTSMNAEDGTYAFEVEKTATKTEIKSAVEKYFNVKVSSVNTMICRGRSRRTRTGPTAVKYWKKALIKLKKGEKISLLEGGN